MRRRRDVVGGDFGHPSDRTEDHVELGRQPIQFVRPQVEAASRARWATPSRAIDGPAVDMAATPFQMNKRGLGGEGPANPRPHPVEGLAPARAST